MSRSEGLWIGLYTKASLGGVAFATQSTQTKECPERDQAYAEHRANDYTSNRPLRKAMIATRPSSNVEERGHIGGVIALIFWIDGLESDGEFTLQQSVS